jgi:hypothetical protein
MKDPLDAGRTSDLFQGEAVRGADPIIPGEASATSETEDEKRRRYERERKRKQRAALKAKKEAANTEAQEDWWNQNRTLLKPQELEAMLEQDTYIQSLMHSMEIVVNVQESDPELIDIIVESVKENGVSHLGRISKNDLPADWSSQQYWRNPDLLSKLTDENWQTAQYVKYGYLAALPDFRVVYFLKDKAGWDWWKAADLVGWSVDQRGTVRYR